MNRDPFATGFGGIFNGAVQDPFGPPPAPQPQGPPKGFTAGVTQPSGSWVTPPAAPAAPPGGPYVSDVGVQPGESQPLEGLDFTKRGPAEQFWIDQKHAYDTPFFGETNAEGIVRDASANRPAQTNNTQNWLDQFSAGMPDIAMDPGLAPYFENAKNRAAESINRSTAATGTYGSSSANDQNARAFTDLEGQRALKEADYNLARLGEQRAWQGLGGQLAGAADEHSLANSADSRGWDELLSKLGIDASRLGLDRTDAGFDAANVAGAAERTRGRDYFTDEASSGDRFAELIKSILGPGLDNEGDLFGLENSGGVADANAHLAAETANGKTATDALKTGWSVYTDPNASWNKPPQ